MKSRSILPLVAVLAVGTATATAGNPGTKTLAKRIQRVETRLNLATRLLVLHDDRIKALENRYPVLTPVQESFATDANGSASGTVQCPLAAIATGGGAVFQSAQEGDHLVFSDPVVANGIPTGWRAAAIKANGGSGTLLVEVICLAAPQ